MKIPTLKVQTPLNTRVYDHVAQYQTIDDNTSTADVDELIEAGRNLLNFEELVYLVIDAMKKQEKTVSSYEASVVLWLLVYKDLLHDNHFLPSWIHMGEFNEFGPGRKTDILSKTIEKLYGINRTFSDIKEVKPIENIMTNPDSVNDKFLSQEYLKPIYNYYANECHATFEYVDVSDQKKLIVSYTVNMYNYDLPLQSWLRNNLPIALALVKSNPDILKTAAIINEYVNLKTNNRFIQRRKSLRQFGAKELDSLSALANHRKSLHQIVKFLNLTERK